MKQMASHGAVIKDERHACRVIFARLMSRGLREDAFRPRHIICRAVSPKCWRGHVAALHHRLSQASRRHETADISVGQRPAISRRPRDAAELIFSRR